MKSTPEQKPQKDELKSTFRMLINHTLPSAYQSPVRFNHCFNRIILDWLFQDTWYNHLVRNKTAISQLSDGQLHRAIVRMKDWLLHHDVLIKDNIASLQYRRKIWQ